MPVAAKRPCTIPGCGALTDTGRCALHPRKPWAGARAVVDRLGIRNQTYNSPRWVKARATFLAHRPFCPCGNPSKVLDHIIPHNGDWDRFWDEDNWQAICLPCHKAKTGRESARIMTQSTRRFLCPVTLVAGPPGSGKSRYVEEHMQWGDLVYDFDTIMVALTNQPMYDRPEPVTAIALHMRDALIDRLTRTNTVHRAWIIDSAPTKAQRQPYITLGATPVVLAVPAHECVARIAADPRRSDHVNHWRAIIETWWRQHDG